MQETKKQNYLKGAAILAAATVFVKIIGAVYKIPLFQDNVLGDVGSGYFQTTYDVYALILTIATAGIPVALSRMISTAAAQGNTRLVRRYFSVAMPTFIVIGAAAMALMYFFAAQIADVMGNSLAAAGIRVLSPAIFFACVISVYRGYSQGYENMVPTAISQVVEVLCKTIFGIAAAMWLVSLGYGAADGVKSDGQINEELSLISAGAIMGVTIGLGLCIPLLIWYKKRDDRALSGGAGAVMERLPVEARLPDVRRAIALLMKVSIPITLGSSFMSIMTVVDNIVVLDRLQSALARLPEYQFLIDAERLKAVESEASRLLGIYAKGAAIYNLPPALIVPVSVSIVPAIAAALAKGNRGEATGIIQSSTKLTSLLAMPAGAGLMVLAAPIMSAVFGSSMKLASDMLIILGAASFFVCFQLVTTAILQAIGHENIALMTFPIGALVKIATGYILAGNLSIGIVAKPIGTLACFIVISVLNMVFILIKTQDKMSLIETLLKPLFCTAVMSVVAYFAYLLVHRVAYGALGSGRVAVIVCLAAAMGAAAAVYAVLIIITRTITMEDMKLVPKGEKLAKILRIK